CVLDPLELSAHDLRTRLGLDVDNSSVLERQLEAPDELPGEAERHARAQFSLGATGVGSGEDLLGGHVGDVLDPGGRLEAGAAPVCGLKQADREVGPGSAIAE